MESAVTTVSPSTPSPAATSATRRRATLEQLRRRARFRACELDIKRDERLHRDYFERIPVVALDGEELCEYFVDDGALRERTRVTVR